MRAAARDGEEERQRLLLASPPDLDPALFRTVVCERTAASGTAGALRGLLAASAFVDGLGPRLQQWRALALMAQQVLRDHGDAADGKARLLVARGLRAAEQHDRAGCASLFAEAGREERIFMAADRQILLCLMAHSTLAACQEAVDLFFSPPAQ